MADIEDLWIPLVDEPIGSIVEQIERENDVPAYDGSASWVEALLRDPAHHAALTAEVRAVAEEVAADPKYAEEGPIGPDAEARERFRAFARDHLGT